MYQIYCIADAFKPLYVGCTTMGLKKRFSAHKTEANTGSKKPLYQHMRDFGIKNVVAFVVCETESKEEAEVL